MNVFDLQAKISLDSSGFEKNLNSAAGHMSGFGSTVEGIFKNIGNALAVAFAVDKVKDFVQGAVTEFARFEQLVGGVDALFGEAAGKTLQENADAAFQTAGLSANAYMDTATSFAASLIQTLGGDTAAAVDMVDMAVTDMADNVNRMGTDIGSIQHAYQGFAKQNYTMLDNLKLGYGGTKAEMARLINDTGILGDTIVELSTMTQKGNFEEVVSFDVVVEAIHQVQEEMNITGTTMEEASGTIEGSINTMKAAWSNWQAGLADPDADMTVLTDNLISSFETAASNVIPAVQRIGDSLGEVFTHITGIDLTPVAAVFDGLKTSLIDIGAAFAEGGVGGGFETIVNALESATGLDLTGLVDGVTGFIDGLKAIDPESLQKVAQSVGVFIENFKDSAIADLMQSIVDGIGDFFDKLGEISPGVIDIIAESIKKFADNFEKIAPWILAAAGAILTFSTAVAALNGIPAIIAAVSGAFATLSTALSVITANPVTAIITAIVAIGTALVTAYHTCEEFRNSVNTLFDVLGDAFAMLGEIIADIPRGIRENVGEMGAAISELLGIVKSKISEFAQAGRDIIAGFVDGVTSKLSAAKDTIVGAFGKVTDWVKGVFDVHSPSRVFAEIGRNLMRGLSVGVDDEADVVQNSINKLRFTVPPISTGKVDFANSALGRTTSAVMNGMMSSGGSSGGAMNINLNVDGRTMAQVMFDPLNNIIKQKGVTLGAQN